MPRKLGRGLIKRDPVCHAIWPALVKNNGQIWDMIMAWAREEMPFPKMKSMIEDKIMTIELLLSDAQEKYRKQTTGEGNE
jgi:hypothetical protein